MQLLRIQIGNLALSFVKKAKSSMKSLLGEMERERHGVRTHRIQCSMNFITNSLSFFWKWWSWWWWWLAAHDDYFNELPIVNKKQRVVVATLPLATRTTFNFLVLLFYTIIIEKTIVLCYVRDVLFNWKGKRPVMS